MKLLTDRLKLSNDEVYLLEALNKYVPIINEMSNDNDEMIEFLRRELTRPKSNLYRQLRINEAIEIAKYCNKSNMIERIKQIQVPVFYLNSADLLNCEYYDEDSRQTKTFSQYYGSKKVRVNALLNELKLLWVNSNFHLTQAELMKSVNNQFLEKFVIILKQKKNKSIEL